jgi:hypothetical protein
MASDDLGWPRAILAETTPDVFRAAHVSDATFAWVRRQIDRHADGGCAELTADEAHGGYEYAASEMRNAAGFMDVMAALACKPGAPCYDRCHDYARRALGGWKDAPNPAP